MSFTQGKHTSFWRDTISPPNYPQLQKDFEVDVLIVGGGITGLSTAYFLQQRGKRVAVVEADGIAAGVSGHTTAEITCEHPFQYTHLNDSFGKEITRLYAAANLSAIETIATIVGKEKIDCDFTRSDQFFLTEKKEHLDKLKHEFEIVQSIDLPVTFADAVNAPFKALGAIQYHNQAHFHPTKYLLRLAEIVQAGGGFIFEHTRAINVTEDEFCVVETERGSIKAKDVVIATHFPILDRGGYFARMKVERSYVLGIYIEEELSAMYDDSEDPYHYIRTQKTDKGQLVLVGGEDHPTGEEVDTNEKFHKLEEFARQHFTVRSIEYYWSSQDNYPHDQLPFIGKYTPKSEHLFVATGFNGWGMTHGTISGMLLTDLITKHSNPWEEVYSPQRLHVTNEGVGLLQTGAKVSKNFVATQLQKLKKSQNYTSIDEVKPGEFATLKINGESTAVYRDRKGVVHAVSAICQHQGCGLHFNTVEESWDCPCHGSRFSMDGEILHGPTVKPLPKIKTE